MPAITFIKRSFSKLEYSLNFIYNPYFQYNMQYTRALFFVNFVEC